MDQITSRVLTYDMIHNKQGGKFPLNFEKFKYESLSCMLGIINNFCVAIRFRTERELS